MERSLGATLKAAREDAGFTLREVERRVGIQNAHLSQIENETISRPEMAMLWDLAALYGLSYTELLGLAGYSDEEKPSARQRQRTTAALRAMGSLTPKEQEEVLRYMAEVRNRRTHG